MSETNGMQLKVGYKHRVYMLTIEPTSETFSQSRHKRSEKLRKTGIQLATESCEHCNSIVVAGICVNKNCPGSQAGEKAV